VSLGQRPGGRAVEGASGQPFSQAPRPVVLHGGRRLVTDVPPGVDQTPDQVHVLTTAEPRIERLAGNRRTTHDQGGAGHVGDPAQWSNEPGRIAAVQRRTDRFVAGQGGGGGHRDRHDPGRHGSDHRVVEVTQERLQPAFVGPAVRVDERHEIGADLGQPGIPGSRRTGVGF
jgi:hypothetical protein